MKPKYLLSAVAVAVAVLVSCGKDNGSTGTGGADQTGNDLSTLPSGNTMVIYEANPKVFSQSAALKAIENNLDRISGLKVNVLWLMPIYPVGSEKSVGSPYCVKDYKAVNPAFGSLDDLKSLVRSAHSKGMKVILDWVANHTAWDNSWIKDHPDWYTRDVGGNIVSPVGMGWSDVADLNYSSAEMCAAMKEAMCWWVSEADVDGFRCDYADGVPESFWTDAISQIRKIKSDAIMLAESNDAKYYHCGFDLMYAWSYADKLPQVYKGASTVSSLYEVVRSDISGLASGQNRMRYIINHDTASENSPVELYGSQDAAMSAFVLSVFLQGVPLIYSSQEIGYAQKLNFFNYNIMSWGANQSYFDTYAKVMSAYLATEKYRGVAPQLIENGKVATICYTAGTHKLLVMVNTSSESQTVKVPMSIAGTSCKDIITGTNITLKSSLALPAYGFSVFYN